MGSHFIYISQVVVSDHFIISNFIFKSFFEEQLKIEYDLQIHGVQILSIGCNSILKHFFDGGWIAS